MSQLLRVATIQPDLRFNQPMPNIMLLKKEIDSLAKQIDLVVLPESWAGLTPGSVSPTSRELLQFLQKTAHQNAVHIVGGSFWESTQQGEACNVTYVVKSDGEIAGRYAKQTLFGAEIERLVPGREQPVFDINGVRVAVCICADLWRYELIQSLAQDVDILCVPAKTGVPSDRHVEYARRLWHGLALTRAMELGLAVVVSDWAAGRHTAKDVDRSVGSIHSSGTVYDKGVVLKRHRPDVVSPTARGPVAPTAHPPSSADPSLGHGVHFTSGASSVCDPGRRPDIDHVQRCFDRGEEGVLVGSIDTSLLRAYRDYRKRVGLMAAGKSE